MVIHIGVFGIVVPLYLIRRFNFKLQTSISRRGMAIVLVALVLVLIAGIFISGSLTTLSKDPPSIAGIVKYVLIFVPMALGICLQCFVLIPQKVRDALGNRLWGSIALTHVVSIRDKHRIDRDGITYHLQIISNRMNFFYPPQKITFDSPANDGFVSVAKKVSIGIRGNYVYDNLI